MAELPFDRMSDAMLRYQLRSRWELCFPEYAAMFGAIEAAHATPPGRQYHNLRHVLACLAEFQPVFRDAQDHAAVELAIWFHDAVYDPTRSDNEARSADLAVAHVSTMHRGPAFAEMVRRLILDTRHAEPPATPDGRLLVDIDLSILGQKPDVFDAYERAIRQEYGHVPDDAFRAGRAAILRKLLGRPALYYTEHFARKYDAAARANLARSIAALSATPPT